ncbi:MAG: bifunctional alpha,alpha-trehalose-phosphate synthase (UDP-forming)/trehalose-phosphatase [Spirochaetes bacterium]|nr:bifunctional alpha,alpha-trehalose-phosphate synthase (UDP-forming)/trehalose-phosphatase [Spirochaetota bacterium]MBN2771211.1 bifunctional alpha,alpha-trehalose-phosphate synthase (UDP-forming)/trehalose-phosphatase [Spirochaetota bacterium]
MSKTIIVSNRLPVNITIEQDKVYYKESIGGLATGLKSFHEDGNTLWVGWDGLDCEDVPENLKMPIYNELQSQYNCIPVELSSDDINDYYLGFCNKTIWPLFHYFQNTTVFDPHLWNAYKQVNNKFFEEIKKIIKKNDTIWIHDYQLFLLPELLRNHDSTLTIGFFLHIPFPSYELFRQLPWREEILWGLTGSDLIGFHTFDYARHFISSIRRVLSLDAKGQSFYHKDRTVLVDVFPMGIDYKKFNTAINEKDILHANNEYAMKTRGNQVVLSVDRLDYTKGIPERIKAVDLFFTENSDYLEKVSFIMIVAPSRSDVDTYNMLLKEIEELVSHTNGKHGTIGWTPIMFFYKPFPFEELVSLYNLADVLLVTPLRDGMNLVAKEYIASRPDKLGTLILSETAGAATELGEALIVNPNDLQMISHQLKVALEMPKREQIERNSILHKRLERYNIFFWASEFMRKLRSIHLRQTSIKSILLKDQEEINFIKAYKSAEKRLIFFDYDGTLVMFNNSPSKAVPDLELKQILTKLTEDPKNIISIVSGRQKEFLEEHFNSFNVNLIANHGLSFKEQNKEWIETEIVHNDWQKEIRPIIQMFTDNTPGSFIEEKTFSLAWHYRRCDPDLSSLRLNDLRETLLDLTRTMNLTIMDGNKVLEVKDSSVNKGKGIQSMLIHHTDVPFVLAVGDDHTDEDMFHILSEKDYSIKIGTGKTEARFHLPDPSSFRALLNKIIE